MNINKIVLFSTGIKATKCCGSHFPTKLAYDAGSLKRVVTYGSFYLGASNTDLVFLPRRIVDLRVEKVMILKGKIAYVFNWTAPGNNYDYGTGKN